MNYSEMLRHPKWQVKRLKVLEAAGFCCTNCGDGERPLHVHHMYYEKGLKPWEYPDEALVCLCEDCHTNIGLAQLDLSRAVAAAGIEALEQIIGYARGWAMMCDYPEPYMVNSEEEARGIADAWGLSVATVIASLSPGGVVDKNVLWARKPD